MDEGRLYRLFGRRLSARRREMQLTQAQLAERVGVSRASIANIERGKQNLPLHQVYRLLDALLLRDVRDLLPAVTAGEPAPSAMPVRINEPKGGLRPEEREQIERLFHDTGAANS